MTSSGSSSVVAATAAAAEDATDANILLQLSALCFGVIVAA